GMEKLALLGGSPVRSTLLPYARQSIDEADIAAVAASLTGDWITQGPSVAGFEAALGALTGATHAVAVSNGTAALHVAYWAAGLHEGDEAITTPLTFAATANAMVYQGVRPLFADVEATTVNRDCTEGQRVAPLRRVAVVGGDVS